MPVDRTKQAHAELEVVIGQCRVANDLRDVVHTAELVETFERALDVGALLHPSEWIAGHENAEQILELILAWRDFAARVEQPLAKLNAAQQAAVARALRVVPEGKEG